MGKEKLIALLIILLIIVGFGIHKLNVDRPSPGTPVPPTTGDSIADDERFGMFVTYQHSTGEPLDTEVNELNINSNRIFSLGFRNDYESLIKNSKRQNREIISDITIVPRKGDWENEGLRYLRDKNLIPSSTVQALAGFPKDIEGYSKELKETIEKLNSLEGKITITTLEIGNEVNWEWLGDFTLEDAKEIEKSGNLQDAFTNYRKDNLEEIIKNYWEFLKINSQVIKDVDPNLDIVLGSGMIEISEKEDIENNLRYFDLVDLHFYGTYREFEDKLDSLDEEFSYTGKPYIGYEIGGPMKYNGLFSETELGKHAEHVVQLHMVGFEKGISRIYYVSLSNIGGYNHEGFYNLGLIDDDGNKKPAYYTYKIMKEKLAGFKSIEKLSENEYYYKVEFEDKPSVFVLWSKFGEKTVDLSEYYSGNLRVSHIVTELKSGNPVYLDDKIASSNSVSISETPIFVSAV